MVSGDALTLMTMRWLRRRCVDADSIAAARGRRWQPVDTDLTMAAAGNAVMSVGGEIVAVVGSNLQLSLLMVRLTGGCGGRLSIVHST